MTDTPQHREPGVRYRREPRTRQVTTVIDGVESVHEETYYVDVPVPPRDWETLVERGLTVWAVVLVAVAMVGTCASVGGLFSELLPSGVAYMLGVVFTGSWLGCMGLEWLDGRIDSTRATAARVGGWIALALGMGAVFVYGHSHDLPWVGAAGACLDLLAKGFCTLLLRRSQVTLPRGVAAWVRHQEERAAGRAVLSGKLGRLNRQAAYRRAVGSQEDRAAQAILAAADQAPHALPDTSRQAPVPVSVPDPDPSGPAPTRRVSAPVPPVSAPSRDASAPVPPAPQGTSGEPVPTSHEVPPAQPGDPQAEPPQAPAPLQPVGPLSIAAAVRQARAEDPDQTDAQMVARVLELRRGDDGGDRVKFTDTVTRTRRRQEAKERKAS
ncbi:hypothetical protein [Streptomyces sp. KAU_LT]|uniref:hypothetical protein n=1 Tax=Streptomyces sp. KAU_LT TaxID=3046669 RepID=UPI0024B7A423|nr:hypothetical protein [Streptomyces sp. KAU_LT]MDI9836247.1 hypothetical protein [Streptomyces sp. KAU_LT]